MMGKHWILSASEPAVVRGRTGCLQLLPLRWLSPTNDAPSESSLIASLLSPEFSQTRLGGGDVFLITHKLWLHIISSEAADSERHTPRWLQLDDLKAEQPTDFSIFVFNISLIQYGGSSNIENNSLRVGDSNVRVTMSFLSNQLCSAWGIIVLS